MERARLGHAECHKHRHGNADHGEEHERGGENGGAMSVFDLTRLDQRAP